MALKDAHFTNLRVNDTLVVEGNLVAGELEFQTIDTEFNVLTIESATIESFVSPTSNFSDITATNSVIQNLITTTSTFANVTISNLQSNVADVSTSSLVLSSANSNTNVLYSLTPANLDVNEVVQFTTNGSTQIQSVPTSTIQEATTQVYYLDGSDGNVTISGGTTTLARDMYYDTLTVDATGILIPAGWTIYCKTALINNGLIHMNGANGVSTTRGDPTAVTGPYRVATSGSNGGAITTNAANAGGTKIIGAAGGNGANSDTGNTGGTVSTSVSAGGKNPETIRKLLFATGLPNNISNILEYPNYVPSIGGAGGGGGSADAGGGGGGGGGFIYIFAKSVSGSGTFECKGGNGGPGGATGGGGGGGGGGVVTIVSNQNSIAGAQVLVTGGTGGTGFLTGSNGGNGFYQNTLLTSTIVGSGTEYKYYSKQHVKSESKSTVNPLSQPVLVKQSSIQETPKLFVRPIVQFPTLIPTFAASFFRRLF